MSNLQKYTPPTLAELTADPEMAFKSDAFKAFLNQPTPAKFIRYHPIVTVKDINNKSIPMPYLPIGLVEHMMDAIFKGNWRVEIKDTGVAFNGVWISVRVHYLNPTTGEWQYHDGIGAEGLQTDSGASASDMTKIKQSAITMAFPKAKSLAIKDACDHLGKLFGRDLTRLSQADHKPDVQLRNKAQERMLALISESLSVEALDTLYATAVHLGDFSDAYEAKREQLSFSKSRTRKPKVNPHR